MCGRCATYVGTLPEPSMPELRWLWRERLEFLCTVAVRDVEEGKPGARRAAVAVAQRAAQLDGLDQPQRLEISGGAAELDRMVRALLAAQGGTIVEEPDIFEHVVDAEVVDD